MTDVIEAGAISLYGLNTTLKLLETLGKIGDDNGVEAGLITKELKDAMKVAVNEHLIAPARADAKRAGTSDHRSNYTNQRTSKGAKATAVRKGRKPRSSQNAPLANWNNAELKAANQGSAKQRRGARGSTIRVLGSAGKHGRRTGTIQRVGGWPLWRTSDVTSQIKVAQGGGRRKSTEDKKYVGSVVVRAMNKSAAGAIFEIAGRANPESTLAKNLTAKFGEPSRLIWHEWDHGAEAKIRPVVEAAATRAAQKANALFDKAVAR